MQNIPTTTKGLRFALFSALLLAFVASASAQSTAFTYQGRLNDGGGLANGLYNLQFALFDAVTNGTQQGSTISSNAIPITNGLFTVTLDFGDQFSSANRWLEIGVTTNGGGSFTKLAPRQLLTATPYAVRAANATTAASANSVAAANITGAISQAQLPASVLTNGASAVNLTGTFTGNGNGLTNLNAVSISSGILPDGRLSTNVAMRSGGNAFFGSQAVYDAFPSGSETVDQQQPTISISTGGSWQSFTAGQSGWLTKIALGVGSPLGATNSPGTISIYSGEGTGGQLLVTRSVTFEPVTGNVFQEYSFSTPPRVQVGNKYTIEFTVPAVSNTWVGASASNPYPGGTHSFGGAYDAAFKTYVVTNQTQTVMTINPVAPGFPTGNVGIGTNLPQAKLHVVGNVITTGTNLFYGQTTATNASNQFAGVFVGNGSGLTNLNVTNLVGVMSLAQLPAGSITNGATITGTFVGNGAGLTNLNVTNLSGTISFAQLPTGVITNGATNITGTFVGNGAGLTDLNAASFSSGTLDAARIPNLDASKITGSFDASKIATGTFDPSRIPSLDASKITSGNLPVTQLSTNVALRIGGNTFGGVQQVLGTIAEKDQSNENNVLYTNNGLDEWQAFTAGKSGALSQVAVVIGSGTAGSRPATVRIHEGEGTGGAVLATADVTLAASLGYQTFTFSELQIQAGKVYTIRITVPSSPTPYLGFSDSNAYPGGRSSFGDTNRDLIFQTYILALSTNSIFMVNQNGVGIGTNAPQAALHVVGDILATGTITGTLYQPYLKFAEVTTGTTQGGAASAGTNNWRNFNAKQFDTYNLGSTNGAGGMVLPVGTYQCRISAPGFSVSTHQIRLLTTTGTQLLYGTIGYCGAGAYANDRSLIDGQITLTNSTTLRVQQWCELSKTINGLGALAGGSTNIWGDTTNINIFATAEFWKIK